MARRKKDEGGGVPEWMCTFGDMMSLLLCFFIMLFSLSIITPIKWEAFIETLQRRMGYSGSSQTPSNDNKPSAALGSTSERSRRTAALSGGQPTPGQAGEFQTTQTIRPDGDKVKGGLIRFDLGSDILNEQAESDLEALLQVLSSSPNKIGIVGHVSPGEEGGEIYSRGDFLAQKRTVVVMEHLISLGLQENFFQTSISTDIPNRAVLPRGTNPRLVGASVAVYLIKGTVRPGVQE